MAANIPAKLKQAGITPFIVRATQLEAAKPVISYWCFYWAVNQILGKGLHSSDDDCHLFTTNLMEKLEHIKEGQVGNDAIHDDVAGQAYVEQFAQETFDRALRPLKANKVTQQTASTFEAAATFFQLVNIWGQADAETQEKIKYAKWNAARILKAIKDGKDPNESNPKQEEVKQEEALDPDDPEVQMIRAAQPRPASVEDAPDDDGIRHPTAAESYQTFPAPVSEPTSSPVPTKPNLEQVSPIVPPGPPTREPGGYFPNEPSAPDTLDLPSTIDMPPPGPATYDLTGSPIIPSPSSHDPALPPSAPPQDFYRDRPSAPPFVPPQQQHHIPPPAPAPSHSYYSQPPQPVVSQPLPVPVQQYNGGAPNSSNVDDMAMTQAQKHAKWAISALNFEDVPTAVRELRAALASLGAQ
ncbi:DUF605-domain-containing protein [Annulohypoxylon maeteangense]|uniref:DUF605-domain-containing protein n=1 Tax=Annulohypoxylon maeteangense TaxID=1927788 RepID=UPI002008A729|nr:DUF605-domain-containing protein [Annulohypoxylon maeteangense]KAI0881605.1 DUF605-domain-containing protein [Annulohypoxylon maeteangense]